MKKNLLKSIISIMLILLLTGISSCVLADEIYIPPEEENKTGYYVPENELGNNQTIVAKPENEVGSRKTKKEKKKDRDEDEEKTYMYIAMAGIGGLVLINLLISIVILVKAGKKKEGKNEK